MLKLNIDESKIFFTADLHYLHSKNIEYSGRPFNNIIEHDEVLINNINEVVKDDCHLFILGDFIFTSNLDIIKYYYSRINGIKYLILGNHCVRNRMYRDSVREIFNGNIFDSLILSVNDDIYWLSHFPHEYFTGKNLHGHIHSGPTSHASKKLPFNPRRYDVGVDNNNYYPVNLEQIKEKVYDANVGI